MIGYKRAKSRSVLLPGYPNNCAVIWMIRHGSKIAACMQLIREIEQTALSIRDRSPDGRIIEIDDPAPDISLMMDRPCLNHR